MDAEDGRSNDTNNISENLAGIEEENAEQDNEGNEASRGACGSGAVGQEDNVHQIRPDSSAILSREQG